MNKFDENLTTCPLCLEVPEKDIFQCRNGHWICSQCLSKSQPLCSQCREPMGPNNAIRARPLEAILDALTFDCPQKEKGCKEKLKRENITAHSNRQCKFNKNASRYAGEIKGGLTPGSTISITGKVWVDVDRFQIDIKSGDGRIIMHFNPRFGPPYISPDANVVVRNTYFTRGWGHEERYSPPFPFVKGQQFKLNIWCELDQFHVAVNSRSFINYKYRIPLEHARSINICGGVDIMQVVTKA